MRSLTIDSPPLPSSFSCTAGGSYKITVACTSGCSGTASLEDVTFGDVWYCFGQSNMALPFQHTYARNATITAIRKGGLYSSIRMTGLKGNMNIDQPWLSLGRAVGGGGAGNRWAFLINEVLHVLL